jgi:hypothetical protein
MQVFRTVMITCILIIWPLVTFEIYFCNSCILHKRAHILIKLHIRSYFYKYIQPYTFQYMHYILYILWYNLTPKVSQSAASTTSRCLSPSRRPCGAQLFMYLFYASATLEPLLDSVVIKQFIYGLY